MRTQIPDIAFEIEGDSIHLEQSIGCGETVEIDLHRIHLQHIADCVGVAIGPDKLLCKRMRLLRERIDDLRSVIERVASFPSGSGPCEEETQVIALCDLAALFCEDLPDAKQLPETNGSAGNPDNQVLAVSGPLLERIPERAHAVDLALETV
jgi:hypothetical protein